MLRIENKNGTKEKELDDYTILDVEKEKEVKEAVQNEATSSEESYVYDIYVTEDSKLLQAEIFDLNDLR